MGGAFFEHIKPTAQALLPLLSSDDQLAALCDDVRSAAYQAWALLIKCARLGSQQRNQEHGLAKELLVTFLQKVMVLIENEKETDAIKEAADGISKSLKH